VKQEQRESTMKSRKFLPCNVHHVLNQNFLVYNTS